MKHERLTKKQKEAVNLMKPDKRFVKMKVPNTIQPRFIYKVGDTKFTEATFRALIHKGVIRYYEGFSGSQLWVLNES